MISNRSTQEGNPKMKRTVICIATILGWAWGGANASAQEPLPRSPGAASPPVYVPAPAPVQPAPAPAPVPVPAVAVPDVMPATTVAVEPTEVPLSDLTGAEDEEGLYWFWGDKWPGLALGPKIGSTGLGADLVFGINSYVNLRAGFNYGTFSLNTSLDGVDYDFDVDMNTLPLLVDIHPFGGHFHISAGVYLQSGTKADIESTPTGNEQIGEHTYPPEVIGTLFGTIEVQDDVAPYLGIGFGNAVGEEQLLTFLLDIGLVFQSYDVELTSNGAGMTTLLDTFRRDLVLEEQNMQDDLDSFRIFPVLTLGLAWHF